MGQFLNARYGTWTPWAMNIPSENGTALEGVLKDVFQALSYSLKYEFGIEYQSDNVFGAVLPNGSVSGMLGSLARNEVDIAGPFSASEQRSQVVDFTNCLEFSRLGIITGIRFANRNMFLYFKVFTWQVWILLVATVVICAFVSVLIHDSAVRGWKDLQGFLVARYIWIFWAYIIGKDAGPIHHWTLRQIWYRHAFRLLLATWLLGPVLNSLYIFQGSVTSSFALNKLKPVISDLNELVKKKKIIPVITEGSAVEICFKTSKEHSGLWKRMRSNSIIFSSTTVEDTLKKVEKGTHVLFADYVYALSIAANWVKRRGRCTIQVQELHFCQNFISLALKKGFDNVKKKKINRQLTYIIQAKLTDRWLNRVHNNYTHCTREPTDESKPLSLNDIMGGLVMWCGGIAAAILLFILELLSYHYQHKKT